MTNEKIVKQLCDAKADPMMTYKSKTCVGLLKSTAFKDGSKDLINVLKPYAPGDFTLAAKAKYAAMELAEKAEKATRKSLDKKASEKPINNYKEGDKVQVFSNSNQVWCDGKVDKIEDDIWLCCSFKTPDGKEASKRLKCDTTDVKKKE